MFDRIYRVEIYFKNKLVKCLAFGDEGLARTYVEGGMEAQAMLGGTNITYEIVCEDSVNY